MLKWISKALGGTTDNVRAEVPEKWLAELEAMLAPIEKLPEAALRKGLTRDMLSYVLEGEPLAVLHELGQSKVVAERLKLIGYHHSDEKAVPRLFYSLFDSVPADVALRWAKLIEACVAPHAGGFVLRLPADVHWPEVLLVHSAGSSLTNWSSQRPVSDALSASTVEKLLIEAGMSPAALLVASFSDPSSVGFWTNQRQLLVSDLKGYAGWLDREVDAIRPLLNGPVAQRLHIVSMLEKAELSTLQSLLPELVEMVVSGSKQVRSATEVLVRRAGKPAFAPLLDMARGGKPDQRLYALRLTHSIARVEQDAAALQLARDAAMADKAASVNALLREWDDEQALGGTAGTQRFDYALPVITWAVTLTPALSTALETFWKTVSESIVKANKQAAEHHERMRASGHSFPLHQARPFSQDDMRQLRAYLESDISAPPKRDNNRMSAIHHVRSTLQTLATIDCMTPVALLKMLLFFDLAVDADRGLLSPASAAFNAMHRAGGRPSLLELSLMLEQAGHPAITPLYSYCHVWGDPLGSDWDREAVWPFFAHQLDSVVQLLTGTGSPTDYWFNRDGLFRGIATLPSPPVQVVSALFGLALGAGKTERPAAQRALENHPGKEARIVSALADGKAETRAVAAQWLGRLAHAPAVEALEQALKKEKNDLAKGAMLDALEALGQPVDKYLDRVALQAEATRSLSKGVPKEIEWFPWAALPAVRWANTGEAVDTELLRWLMVQAVKQKQSEPNTMLRKVCAMFDPRDRETLGQFILEAWLHEDVRPIAPEDAMRLAQSAAQSMHQYMASYPQHFQNNPGLGQTVEQLTASYLPKYLRQPAGSASGSKGLLAIAAVCARGMAAAPVARYLKEWYGSRAAQGKALIAMLAWIEHPGATQLMLSIGSRFRTKSFQEEATRQATALAERKGWTLAELADRTIPTAGFDDNGELELSYGMRSFTAHLHADFKIDLSNQDGKKIAALPEPRQDDDADLAKDAKKAFSAAKKEIKGIVTQQGERLYEALCTEREWSFEDWSLYMNRHPVVRHLVQRLVWVEVGDEGVLRSFRPLGDGTLTDFDDEELNIEASARIRIAHDSLLDAEHIARWQQHLADYEIAPLFQQMGKGIYTPTTEVSNSNGIKDFEGHLVEAFALRGRSLKLGYTRGPTEDAGWFYSYEKRFPTLGLQAVIQFTGNPLPEQSRTVALLNLSFASTAATSTWQRASLPLNKVPRILLSECYNDLRLIASEGTGFDPEWQKKSEY
ncbi:DUF4132 domain-containing protein [Herbaspirillum sp. NPDC087042]|uniref:DUF4132 domain-containing protein n=1 Tax=Herbaspirillum sp. NPDC087042 TaxID=3364004 RepID=UPI003815980B